MRRVGAHQIAAPQARGVRTRTRLAVLGAAAGCLVALSVPPFGWWPLAWFGFAMVAFVVRGRGVGERAALGFGLGLAQFGIGLWWVNEFSVAGFIGVLLVSVLYTVLALLVVPSRRPIGTAVGLPAALLLADWARDHFPLGGLPLGSASLGQAAGPLVPVARIGGSVLLTAATVVCGVAIAELARWLRGSRRIRRLAPALVATAVAVAVPALGLVVPSGGGGGLAPIRVALVQGGGKRGTREIHTNPQVVFDRHLQESSRLKPPLDLVVWPEGILQSSGPFQQTRDAGEIAALAKRLRATVISGVEQDVGATRYLNEVVAWSPSGRIQAKYVKNHLVPFGEYVPYRSLIKRFFNLADVPYDGIPGHGPGFMSTSAGPLGVMISYEDFFDSRARAAVAAGGQVLVVPTNTASYRSTQVPAQELAASRIRAWETGRWLVQVTPVGYSAVVSPTGAVVARSHLDRAEVVVHSVPMESGTTPFVAIGEWPFVSGAAASIAAVVVAGRLDERRARAARGA